MVTLSVQEARTILNRGSPPPPYRTDQKKGGHHVKASCRVLLHCAAHRGSTAPLVGGRLWESIMLLTVVALNIIVDTLLKEK